MAAAAVSQPTTATGSSQWTWGSFGSSPFASPLFPSAHRNRLPSTGKGSDDEPAYGQTPDDDDVEEEGAEYAVCVDAAARWKRCLYRAHVLCA